MPERKLTQQGTWSRQRESETGRKVVVYGQAYKLAWQQIPPTQRRERPDISLRIHASIRRQLKAGETDPCVIAFAAVKDALVPESCIDQQY